MPPKPKYTREEIISAALELAAKKGIEAFTARNLGKALGTSTCPIFTAFKSMDELYAEVRNAAMKRFEEYAEHIGDDMPVFKQVGMQMITFAAEQPKLFRLLFMSENANAKSFDDMFDMLGDTAVLCIEAICHDYGLDRDKAMLLFRHNWIYTYGIGVLTATGFCTFEKNEISEMMSREFAAMLTFVKSGKADNA